MSHRFSRRFPVFGSRSVENLTTDFAKTRKYLEVGSNRGLMSADDWARAVAAMSDWEIPRFDAAAAQRGYGKYVDMSYLEDARKETGK